MDRLEELSIIGWDRNVLGYSYCPCPNTTIINSCIDADCSGHRFLVEDSYLAGRLVAGEGSIVSNVISSIDIKLDNGIILHQLPISGEEGETEYVTRIYGVQDNPKDPIDSGTYCNIDWSQWLGALPESVEERIWEHVRSEERTLWNARLFPVCTDRDESLRLALWLQNPICVSTQAIHQWLNVPRVSLEECIRLAHRLEILKDQTRIENAVRRKIFVKYIAEEKDIEDFGKILGSDPVIVVSNLMHSAKEISRSDNALYRMRGYRVVAEILRELKIDPLTELQIAATTENLDGTDSEPFTWSAFEDKAFRELAYLIQSHCPTVSNDECREFKHKRIAVRAACRADIAGGWSDTPPFSVENGGVVLNCAISLNGELPILVEARVLDEPKLILASEDLNVRREFTHTNHLLNYDDPSDPLALHKAALILTGIIPQNRQISIGDLFSRTGNGLELITRVDVPKGSGLGTSSILAGAVIVCLHSMLGRELSENDIFGQVLTLEQMLTTGGGWQDQIGGLAGGVKLVRSCPGVPQTPTYEEVVLSDYVKERFDKQFALVYTGQRRLAKRILRNIMGDYILRKKETVNIIHHIQEIALSIRNALVAGDFEQMGRLMAQHWELNKRLDSGSTNAFIDSIFKVCEPYVYGGKLCGAGGGGFMELILREDVSIKQLNEVFEKAFPVKQVRVWDSQIAYKAFDIERSV